MRNLIRRENMIQRRTEHERLSGSVRFRVQTDYIVNAGALVIERLFGIDI